MLDRNSIVATHGECMVHACEKALDAGLFYAREFSRFVKPLLPSVVFSVERIEVIDNAMLWDNRQVLLRTCQNAVNALPRGTCIAIRYAVSQKEHFEVLMSDGRGNLATGLKYISFDTIPSADTAIDAMLEYEIFLCRSDVERLRGVEGDIAAIKEHGLNAGFEVEGRIEFSGEVYRNAAIASIAADGQLTVVFAKRGGKRVHATMSVSTFVNRLGIIKAKTSVNAESIINTQTASLF